MLQPGRPNVSTVYDPTRDMLRGKVVLAYRGRHLPPALAEVTVECEVYGGNGAPLLVHSKCPKCLHDIKIDGERKRIEHDAEAGTLRSEKFRCTWEEGADRRQFGLSLCGFTCVYDGREIRDA